MSEFSPFWSSFRPKNETSLPRIGFTDSDDDRIISAVKKIKDLKIADPVKVETSNPSMDKSILSQVLHKSARKESLDAAEAEEKLNDTLYLGIAALLSGQLDGLVTGANRPTADVVKGALAFIGPAEGYRLIAGHFLVESKDLFSKDNTPFLLADCAVIPDPSSRALAAIAAGAARSFRFFTGATPKVAILSFSTRGSARHAFVDKVKEAVNIVKKQEPDLDIDGELQADAALDKAVALRKKAGDSKVAGEANVFIFPSLEAGNIGYKLIQRFSETRVAGPILWGLKKPMSDLSRGCTVREIIDTTMCVAMMAERMK